MYLRNELEVHNTAKMIRNTGTLSKNIAIYDPDLTEWVMMYFALNPSFDSTIAVNVDLNYFRRVSWVMYLTVPSFTTEHMGVSRFAPVRLRVF